MAEAFGKRLFQFFAVPPSMSEIFMASAPRSKSFGAWHIAFAGAFSPVRSDFRYTWQSGCLACSVASKAEPTHCSVEEMILAFAQSAFSPRPVAAGIQNLLKALAIAAAKRGFDLMGDADGGAGGRSAISNDSIRPKLPGLRSFFAVCCSSIV